MLVLSKICKPPLFAPAELARGGRGTRSSHNDIFIKHKPQNSISKAQTQAAFVLCSSDPQAESMMENLIKIW